MFAPSNSLSRYIFTKVQNLSKLILRVYQSSIRDRKLGGTTDGTWNPWLYISQLRKIHIGIIAQWLVYLDKYWDIESISKAKGSSVQNRSKTWWKQQSRPWLIDRSEIAKFVNNKSLRRKYLLKLINNFPTSISKEIISGPII